MNMNPIFCVIFFVVANLIVTVSLFVYFPVIENLNALKTVSCNVMKNLIFVDNAFCPVNMNATLTFVVNVACLAIATFSEISFYWVILNMTEI